MATSLTWVGGGNNEASNAKDWSPNEVPASGETLSMAGGTMNIKGAALAGDTLYVSGYDATDTLNLTGATLTAIDPGVFSSADPLVMNLTGDNAFNLILDLMSPPSGPVVVNMGKNATWTGLIDTDRWTDGDVTINGGTFINNTDPNVISLSETFNCAVAGTGIFNDYDTLTFLGSVSAGQTISIASGEGLRTSNFGTVNIGDPTDFKGSIVIVGDTSELANLAVNADGLINLTGLQATSYTYENDVLTLFNGSKVIDTLNLITPYGVSVDQTSVGISVYSGYSPQSNPQGTAVPVQSTSLTWVGGGNNNASNAKDWSTDIAPTPGDYLTMNTSGTMNISGNTLAGDTLTVVGGVGAETLNLSNASLVSVTSFGDTALTLNLTGNNSFALDAGRGNPVIVDLGKNAVWTGEIGNGSVTADLGSVLTEVIVNGGTYINNSSEGLQGPVTFNTNVEGNGTLLGGSFGSSFTFLGAVGAGQNVDFTGSLDIGDPTAFKGTVGGAAVTSQNPNGPTPGSHGASLLVPDGDAVGQITLAGLVQSTAYTFANDILTLFDANKVVDTLNLITSGVTVDKTSTGITIFAGGDTPPSGFAGIALPVHT